MNAAMHGVGPSPAKRPHRWGRRARAAVALSLIAVACVAHAKTSDVCDALSLARQVPATDHAKVLKIQAALAQVYSDDATFTVVAEQTRLNDGVMGSTTTRWLGKFCSELRVAEAGPKRVTVDEALIAFVGILSRKNQWRGLLKSDRLSIWIDAQPAPARMRDFRTRLVGSDAEVDVLLGRYTAPAANESGLDNCSAAAGTSDADPDPDKVAYYRLGAGAILQRKALAKATEVLLRLRATSKQDQTPISADELQGQLKAAGLPKEYVPIVKRHAESLTTYQLTDESIQLLQLKLAPAATVKLAQSPAVQHKTFATEEKLRAALVQAAGDHARASPVNASDSAAEDAADIDILRIVQARIVVLAPMFTTQAMAALLNDPDFVVDVHFGSMPDDVAAVLKRLEGVEYPTRTLFCAAVRAALKDSVVSAVLKKLGKERPFTTSELLLERAKTHIAEVFGERQKVFAGSLADSQNQKAVGALSSYSGISPMEQQSPTLLRAYAKQLVPPVNDAKKALWQTEDTEHALRQMIRELFCSVPATDDGGADRTLDLRNPGHCARNSLGGTMRSWTDPYLAQIAVAARQQYRFSETRQISWSADKSWSAEKNCGCVLQDRLPGIWGWAPDGEKPLGTAYGLAPLWQAGGPLNIDFEVLSRIGLYAIPVGDDGELLDPLKGQSAAPDWLDFAEEAHRHRTSVDWIIRRTDWETWKSKTREARQTFFRDLTKQIDNMLQETTGGWFRRALSQLTFGAVPVVKRGDGVTLYFEHYPGDLDSVEAFKTFHHELNVALRRSIGDDYAVNVLLSRNDLGSGLFGCDNLADLLRPRKDDAAGQGKAVRGKGHFLVFMDEPTTNTKKGLRQELEDCQSGQMRIELQNAIVPVIVYDGKRDGKSESEPQFRDDNLYFSFNFGGVGLWLRPENPAPDAAANASPTGASAQPPLPEQVGKPGPAERMGGFVRDDLLVWNPDVHAEGTSGDDRTAIDRLEHWRYLGLVWIVEQVCPHRWLFRGLLEIFALLMIVPAVALWANCRWRGAFLAVNKWYTLPYIACVALTLVLFLALLYGDPALATIRDGNYPFIVLAFSMLGFAIWFYLEAKRKALRP